MKGILEIFVSHVEYAQCKKKKKNPMILVNHSPVPLLIEKMT